MTSISRLCTSYLTVAGILFTSGSTQAQDLVLPPDFAQVRPGLPATSGGTQGGAYCGPTSAADYLQWLNDNGWPELGSLGATSAAITMSIFGIGLYLNTDPDGGTTVDDMVEGIQTILDESLPGRFDVGYIGREAEDLLSESFGHSFGMIGLHLGVGHLVIARVGWYELPEGNRCSGHYVAMTGFQSLGGTDFEARYRDPARETNTVSTKTVTLETLDLEDGDGVIRNQTASSWNWLRGGEEDCNNVERTGVQDGLVYIGGMRLFSENAGGGLFTGYNLAHLQVETRAHASGGDPTSVAPHPYLYDLYHCRPSANQIFKTDFRTNLVSTVPITPALNQPRRLAFGPDAILYILQGDTSQGFTLLAVRSDGSLLATASQSTMGAIAYHERYRRIYWWTGPSNQIRQFNPDLTPAGPNLSLPQGPPFVAPGYLIADPRGDVLYYNHQGSIQIFRFNATTGAELSPLADTQLVDPADMVVDNRGYLYVAQGSPGSILEFDPAGLRVFGSPAESLQGKNLLALTRSSRRPVFQDFVNGNTDADLPLDDSFLDCNANGIPDDQDISEGWSRDRNRNGTPDDCERLKPSRIPFGG